MQKYRLYEKHAVHLSPAFGVLEPSELASWMLASPTLASPTLSDGPNVRLHLQLHKYIWPRVERGV
jgi:7-carboxy-7-deazaguanine synthase